MHKPVYKWAGGKTRLVPTITQALPAGNRLVEPYCGSCAIALNTNYNQYCQYCQYCQYWMNDSNTALIDSYWELLNSDVDLLLEKIKYYYENHGSKDGYLTVRQEYNNGARSAAAMVYLNRHCFNGLWRVNSKGAYNVPYGDRVNPHLPEEEIRWYQTHFKNKVHFTKDDFRRVFSCLREGDVVYADPPYLPLSETSNYTGYTAGGYSLQDQKDLAACAETARSNGIPVLVSNHDTPLARDIFKRASKIESYPVRRSISAAGGSRREVREILAHYLP